MMISLSLTLTISKETKQKKNFKLTTGGLTAALNPQDSGTDSNSNNFTSHTMTIKDEGAKFNY